MTISDLDLPKLDFPQARSRLGKWIDRALSLAGILFGFGDEIVTITAATVGLKKINWLWPGRIPLGKLSLFVGNPDNAKSLVALDVAAKLSAGRDWFEARNTIQPSDVLVFASEDDPADTTVPRLVAAGADLQKIHFGKMTGIEGNEREMQLDKDISAIQKTISQNPNIRLLVIDPISSYLGATKMIDEQAVRRVLGPLQSLAAETGIAVIGIMHLNKKADLQVINRIGGAMAFVGVARAVWLFTADDHKPGTFHMLRVKNNIADRKGGLTYEIAIQPVEIEGDNVQQPRIEWTGQTDLSADQVLAARKPGRPKELRNGALQWLQEFLKNGPRSAGEIEAEGNAAGFSPRTLDRAKKDLNIKSFRENDLWYWRLP